MKTCSICKEAKEPTAFSQQKGTPDGLRYYCKVCDSIRYREWREKNRVKIALDMRAYRQSNREKFVDYELKKSYGLPHGSYRNMLDAQEGKCAICHAEQAGGRGRFHVDHCHSTGKIRGLLCNNCNNGLGKFKDEVALLRLAIEYLQKHQ